MTTKLSLLGGRSLAVRQTWQQQLVDYLANKAESTRKTYQVDWDDFVRWSGHPDLASVLDDIFGTDDSELRLTIAGIFLRYQTDLLTRPVWDRVADRKAGKPASREGLAASTVARRLKAFKALVGIAQMSGRCPHIIYPPIATVETFRDTAGIGRTGWLCILDALDRVHESAGDGSQAQAVAVRDRAILRLLHDCGLRRTEVVRLQLSDIADDLESMMVWGKGKDKTRKKRIPLASAPSDAVSAWMAARARSPGALFTKTTDSVEPLTHSAVNKLVMRWGRQAGLLRATPHQLRHAAITTLAMKGASLLEMQAFARHANPQTTQIYIDNLGEGIRRMQDLLKADEGEELPDEPA